MKLYAGNVLHPRCPVVLEVEDSLLLAPRADGLVEVDRLADALFDGEAARAQYLELADVGSVRVACADQRPQLRDLLLLYPQHARTDGRRKKLVQAGAEV